MSKKQIIKSSILSQLVGYTFLGSIALIIDSGLSQISIIFLVSFIICIILLYLFEIKPTINQYKNSSEDINISYQPIAILIPSFHYQLLIGLLCISIYFHLFNIELLQNFFLFYGIICLLLFLKNQFSTK